MQSRFPKVPEETGMTAHAYSVFQGFDEIFEGFDTWLARRSGARVHGHLFDWDAVPFAGGEAISAGGLKQWLGMPRLWNTAPL